MDGDTDAEMAREKHGGSAGGAVSASPGSTVSLGTGALRELRATRQRHRLGDLEWFDAAYKVYVVALFGGIVLLWLSDLVGDEALSAAQAANASQHGPAVLGAVAVLALAAGLRSGSQGGPLALEAADVAHVMLAPIDRRRALLRPTVQRLRSAAFAAAVVAACLAQLAGRRLPGSPIAWFAAGGLFGTSVALLWVGGALVAHAVRLPLAAATTVGIVLCAWQAAAIAWEVPGPGDLHGSLALWGWRQHPLDVVALIATAGLVGAGVALVGRVSLEALARRADLVAQLRFAVTMQDLRTVVLLRRQLSYDHTRRRPWIRLGSSGRAPAVWRRGWHSLLRFPTGRLLRMLALALGAAACQVAVVHGTSPALFGTLVCTFVLGLEVLEPLSQEVDQPDRTDSFPMPRGELMARHLAAPAVVLFGVALLGASAGVAIDAVLTDGDRVGAAIPVAILLSFAAVYAGAAGATVSIVRDAPDPLAGANQDVYLPPEMAGFTTVLRTLIPLLVSAFGAAWALGVRVGVDAGDGSAALGAGVRAAVATTLLVAAVVTWVRSRDRLRAWFRTMMSDSRDYQQQRRGSLR
jgi:hypothetical protein